MPKETKNVDKTEGKIERENGLPEGWAWATLKEVTTKKVEQVKRKGPLIYIDISAIDNCSKTVTDPKKLGEGDKIPSRARQLVEPNDILVSMTRPNLNAVAKVPTRLDGAIGSTGFDVLRAIEVEPEWIFNTVRSRKFVNSMSAIVQGALYPAVRPSDVRSYQIPLAPKAEQSRIVSAIESLQTRSSRSRDLLSEVGPLIGQLRQSVLRSAFSGDLTSEWRRQNPDVQPASELVDSLPEPPKPNRAKKASIAKIPGDSGLAVGLIDKEIPATWSWTRLTRIGQLVTGHTPSRKHPEYWDGAIPWIGIKDARNNDGKVIEDTLQHVTQAGLDNSASRLLPKGTVLMTRTANSIGYSTVLGKDMATSQDLVGWIFPEEINPKFIMYLVLAENEALYRFAKGSAHPTVYFPEILSLHVALPPKEEQNEIVSKVELAFSHLEVLSEEVVSMESSLTQLDQSILAKAFRGELVPQDPNDEPACELLARIRAAREQADEAKKAAKQKKKGSKSKRATKSQVETVQISLESVAFDLLLLLQAWNKPVSIWILESALALMQRDDLISKFKKTRSSKRKPKQVTTPIMKGMQTEILGSLVGGGAIKPVGDNGYELTDDSHLKNASQARRDRAAAAIGALEHFMERRELDEQQARDAIAAQVGTTYEIKTEVPA